MRCKVKDSIQSAEQVWERARATQARLQKQRERPKVKKAPPAPPVPPQKVPSAQGSLLESFPLADAASLPPPPPAAPPPAPPMLVHLPAPMVRRKILLEVAHEWKIAAWRLQSSMRIQELVQPRHIAFWLCQQMAGSSLPAIGRSFGGRDHTTVLWGIRRAQQRIDADAALASRVQAIRERVEAWKSSAAIEIRAAPSPAESAQSDGAKSLLYSPSEQSCAPSHGMLP